MQRVLFILLALLFSIHGNATNTNEHCKTQEYQQFGFWLGEWRVYKPDGTLAGENTIEYILSECVIKESYSTASGYQGHSFNIYDKNRKLWHQTWVDNTGLLLQLEGHLVDGKMILEGAGKSQNGDDIIHRITWIPNKDGSVRQLWQTSKDDKKTWATLFDGLYKTQSTP